MGSLNKHVSLMLHVVGIYAFFLVFGIYGEKLTTTTYHGRRYESVLFPLVLQSLGGIVIGRVMMSCKGVEGGLGRAILFHYAYLASLSLISAQLGFLSLRYISYPTLIIAKSCKLLPIALMNFLIYRRTLTRRKYFSLCLISISVLSFSYFDGKNSSGSRLSLIGILVLTTSLLADGIINSTQDHIFRKFQASSFHMMYYTNLFRFLISFTVILLTDNLRYSIAFIKATPEVAPDLLLYSTFNIFGQIVIYSMIQSHGSLTLTKVNLTRKMFSILLSLIVFGHKIKKIQALSILGVLGSIALEAFDTKTQKQTGEKKHL
ncbi:UAA transporter protein [Encephalitozoon intestinalis ATCC 50506]|uniref:UDP-galactose transporter homolog 1 n=1 Tax=Encephalitozoon intestinalis (strain ATCC 50506) TaxID=876142 RepID=E0S6K6_ENCIT|nr:UAA transporter protein [Encephalitozoon intestinalis ATCC 50506]ADM11341.1 UAA transporter protein [Encephalitozoon intestinalis ATCC 50506]UTX45029.1 UAA transporter protein [Encephalitozoon intestinalis]